VSGQEQDAVLALTVVRSILADMRFNTRKPDLPSGYTHSWKPEQWAAEIEKYLPALAAAPAVLEWVRKVAAIPICSDAGESGRCCTDSGPYCGVHLFDDYLVEEARAILASAATADRKDACGAICPLTNARCELPAGHENHRGPYEHGIVQWPRK
jgi:hypothetical protein